MISVSYLACPHQHKDKDIKRKRLDAVTHVAALLHGKEDYVYSPLTHNLPMSCYGLEQSFDLWKAFDLEMVERCDRLYVLTLPGWDASEGVQAEIAHAKKLNKPIKMLEYDLESKQLLERSYMV
ncbi:hypothetical protein COB11_00765 [Candidatus Aerophobetes bacterium]|uniref:DUF1937 domain-containing protein n=1 Tax=Aerophobetes bacterium TaxID=2030807 RepID=A0A2A4YMA5_UNCAE|nr:MAG: hypothetical protein COB11_00765 [Candidatus Aerophobetes bacterium]